MAAARLTGIVMACVCVSGCDRAVFDQQVQHEMNRIEVQVAEDAVKQYEIAKRSGNAVDAAVHAGIVAAAYLQAKDETNYKKWKAIQEADESAAGF